MVSAIYCKEHQLYISSGSPCLSCEMAQRDARIEHLEKTLKWATQFTKDPIDFNKIKEAIAWRPKKKT